jgi:hypothetical protein
MAQSVDTIKLSEGGVLVELDNDKFEVNQPNEAENWSQREFLNIRHALRGLPAIRNWVRETFASGFRRNNAWSFKIEDEDDEFLFPLRMSSTGSGNVNYTAYLLIGNCPDSDKFPTPEIQEASADIITIQRSFANGTFTSKLVTPSKNTYNLYAVYFGSPYPNSESNKTYYFLGLPKVKGKYYIHQVNDKFHQGTNQMAWSNNNPDMTMPPALTKRSSIGVQGSYSSITQTFTIKYEGGSSYGMNWPANKRLVIKTDYSVRQPAFVFNISRPVSLGKEGGQCGLYLFDFAAKKVKLISGYFFGEELVFDALYPDSEMGMPTLWLQSKIDYGNDIVYRIEIIQSLVYTFYNPALSQPEKFELAIGERINAGDGYEWVDGLAKETADRIGGDASLQGQLTAIGVRVGTLENLGNYVGSFATFADLPDNKSSFPNDITINDFTTIRVDETHNNLPSRYVASAIDETTGAITWTYDLTYSNSGGGADNPSQGTNKINASDGSGGWRDTQFYIEDGETVNGNTQKFIVAGGSGGSTVGFVQHGFRSRVASPSSGSGTRGVAELSGGHLLAYREMVPSQKAELTYIGLQITRTDSQTGELQRSASLEYGGLTIQGDNKTASLNDTDGLSLQIGATQTTAKAGEINVNVTGGTGGANTSITPMSVKVVSAGSNMGSSYSVSSVLKNNGLKIYQKSQENAETDGDFLEVSYQGSNGVVYAKTTLDLETEGSLIHTIYGDEGTSGDLRTDDAFVVRVANPTGAEQEYQTILTTMRMNTSATAAKRVVFLMPSAEVDDIDYVGAKALITKEYVDEKVAKNTEERFATPPLIYTSTAWFANAFSNYPVINFGCESKTVAPSANSTTGMTNFVPVLVRTKLYGTSTNTKTRNAYFYRLRFVISSPAANSGGYVKFTLYKASNGTTNYSQFGNTYTHTVGSVSAGGTNEYFITNSNFGIGTYGASAVTDGERLYVQMFTDASTQLSAIAASTLLTVEWEFGWW